MTPGVFARTYPSKVPETLFARIRADGFEAVQFNLACAGLESLPAAVPGGVAGAVAEAAQRHGLAIAALSGTYNMAHPDPARRAADRARFAGVIAAAKDMGAPLVTLCTGSRDPADMWRAHPGNAAPEAWADMCAEIDAALGLAEAAGLTLAIEPEPGNVVADARLARRLLDEVGDRPLGIILDAANLLPPEALPRQAEVVAEAAGLLAGSLRLVHVKDVDAAGRVVPAGQGAVDLPAFIARVRATGYDGALIAHGFDAPDAPAVAAVLHGLIGASRR